MKKKLTNFKKIIKSNKQFLKENYNVSKIGIFGSYVRNSQKSNSDLDILVDLNKPISFFQFLQLEEDLKKMLKIKIDLVTKKALKKNIGKIILKEIEYI